MLRHLTVDVSKKSIVKTDSFKTVSNKQLLTYFTVNIKKSHVAERNGFSNTILIHAIKPTNGSIIICFGTVVKQMVLGTLSRAATTKEEERRDEEE